WATGVNHFGLFRACFTDVPIQWKGALAVSGSRGPLQTRGRTSGVVGAPERSQRFTVLKAIAGDGVRGLNVSPARVAFRIHHGLQRFRVELFRRNERREADSAASNYGAAFTVRRISSFSSVIVVFRIFHGRVTPVAHDQ